MAKQFDIHADLIRACKTGDNQARKELYTLYAPAMYNVSLRIVGQREDAEDLIQESFIKAFKSINGFKEESSFGSWLKRIVINSSLNHLRAKVKFKELEEAALDSGQVKEEDELRVSDEYELSDVKKALNTMPIGFRTVFNLYYFEDLAHKEIAKLLDISVSTSKSQLNRARNKMKLELIRMKNDRRQA